MMDTMRTPEEQETLAKEIRGLAGWDAAEAAWEAGYAARRVREKDGFSSAHGTRTLAVLKALLAIITPRTSVEVSVVQAAIDFIGELEKVSEPIAVEDDRDRSWP